LGHELHIPKPKTSLYSKRDHIYQKIFIELTSQEWFSLCSARALRKYFDKYGPFENIGGFGLWDIELVPQNVPFLGHDPKTSLYSVKKDI